MRLIDRKSTGLAHEKSGIIPQVIFLLIMALAGLGFFLYVSEPMTYQAAPAVETQQGKAAPTAVATLPPPAPTTTIIEPTPTPTPLPQEFLENREQTIGIIAVTIALVIIIIGGTLRGIWARQRE